MIEFGFFHLPLKQPNTLTFQDLIMKVFTELDLVFVSIGPKERMSAETKRYVTEVRTSTKEVFYWNHEVLSLKEIGLLSSF